MSIRHSLCSQKSVDYLCFRFLFGKTERLELYYLPTDLTDLVPGDVIMTSGLGGIFPKGIRVGTVQEVLLDSDSSGVNATLVDVSGMDTRIVTCFPPWTTWLSIGISLAQDSRRSPARAIIGAFMLEIIAVAEDGVVDIIVQLGSQELAFHGDGNDPENGNLILFFVQVGFHMNWVGYSYSALTMTMKESRFRCPSWVCVVPLPMLSQG